MTTLDALILALGKFSSGQNKEKEAAKAKALADGDPTSARLLSPKYRELLAEAVNFKTEPTKIEPQKEELE
jgi:hypothetical protein